jgi:prevent-host-death family protein
MKVANIAEFKNNLSRFLIYVQQGEIVEVRKRNVPVARVVPVEKNERNKTRLGVGADTVNVLADLTEPLIAESDWEMLE